jgi:rare lipoprotein A
VATARGDDAAEPQGVVASGGASSSSPGPVVVPVRSAAAADAAPDGLALVVARDAPPLRSEARSPAAAAEGTASDAERGFWVQLGAFRERSGAAAFQRQVADALAWLSPRLAVHDDAPLFRLQAGPYANREDARGAAESIRNALQLVPVIVERR